MLLASAAVIIGLIVLVWSADRFVEGAAITARHFGMAPLLVGMLVIGFGTSAPEMVVSALASFQGNPGLALGNAYGSNITNIALILGITAILAPIAVGSEVLRREMPILGAVTLLSAWLIWDLEVSFNDAMILLLVFASYIGWSIWQGMKNPADVLSGEVEDSIKEAQSMPLGKAVMWLIIGLVLLILSSRALVWGAVDIASALGISDLVIGLTIVAIGTSLPELASAIAAARKNEPDLVIGNIIGSNFFNTLAVVGIAGSITPIALEPEVIERDWFAMMGLTLLLGFLAFRFNKANRINRWQGGILVICYIGYTVYLLNTGIVPAVG